MHDPTVKLWNNLIHSLSENDNEQADFFHSLFMESDSDSSEENWTSVLDAVRAYVAPDNVKLPPPRIETKIPTQAGRIASTRKMVDTSSHSDHDSTQGTVSERFSHDDLEVMRNTSEELQSIMYMLGKDFPAMLSEAVLLAEEERAVREKAVAELEVIRSRWKADVKMLTGIINKKNEAISNLQKLVYPSSRVGMSTDPSTIARKLSEAESEIARLHELIECQHSAR